MKIGNREFDFTKNIYIMGILNVTPDSFSDGGQFDQVDNARAQVAKMIEEGADIIDVGGESTRPGHEAISSEEEIERVQPVIEMIAAEFETTISIDTSKAAVAKAAIQAGAHMVNDVWGLKNDQNMAEVIAEAKVPVCIMHNRENDAYEHVIIDMTRDLGVSIKYAMDAGIPREHIIVDPGIGFAKSLEDNLEVMRNLRMFTQLGYPMMLGTSRKSMIGLPLDLPVEERVEGTLVTTVIGIQSGATLFRVHDVKENKRAIDMTRAIYNV